jgi:hypothetical protein
MLTANQIKSLNNLSMQRDRTVALGTLLMGIPEYGTPVKWVKAAKALTVGGVVIHKETVTINNPAISGSNVYEFLADASQTKTLPGNIAVDISTHSVKGSVTLTMDTQATAGNTMTIGTKVYTFVPSGTANADGEISVGTDLPTAKLAVVAAINGTDGVNTPHPLVTAAPFAVNVCTITALVGGVAGNAVATTETFTPTNNVFSAGTLTSGADCTAQNAIDHLVAAVTAHDTQGVGAVDSTGAVVTFSADVAGVAGNAIVIGETMANGAFAGGAVLLSGGVDGTPVAPGRVLVDDSYLYVYISDDWRRISVGSAY